MKKIVLVIVMVLVLVLLTGCYSSKDIVEGGTVTKSIHARISNLDGSFEEVEVERYSLGYASAVIQTTDNRKFTTALTNVVLIEKTD